MLALDKKNSRSGFTIIEVMIVLGIAAAIMLIVLFAIPQLQRNQRNTQRKEAVARVNTELANYASNNNGSYPNTAAALTSFTSRYLSEVKYVEPRTSNNMTIVLSANTTLPTYAADLGEIFLHINSGATGNGFECNGELVQSAANETRSYALSYALEGGAIFCVDNK